MMGKAVIIVGLMLLVTLGSGCVTTSDNTDEDSDEITQKGAESPQDTFFLLFPDPCPSDNMGVATYNNTESSWDEAGSCGPEILDHIPDEQRCGIFRIHDEEFRLREGDGISANVTVRDGPGAVTIRFVWRDDDGLVAEATSRTSNYLGRFYAASRASTVVDRDSSGDVWLDVFSDGGKCDGVRYGGSNPSRFCTHAPDHEHGVAPQGGHCTPW